MGETRWPVTFVGPAEHTLTVCIGRLGVRIRAKQGYSLGALTLSAFQHSLPRLFTGLTTWCVLWVGRDGVGGRLCME